MINSHAKPGRGSLILLCTALLICSFLASCLKKPDHVTVASKAFTESVILGEIAARRLRADGIESTHCRELGGTRLVWDALLNGQIDAYPEYTGTLTNEIFSAEKPSSDPQLRDALARKGVGMTRPLGFNDTYALGMREDVAQRLLIRTLSDLARHPELKFGFSNEFLDRADGWPALRAAYHLSPSNVTGLTHDLAYRALANGSIDVTDLYSTDAEIQYYHLRVLADDLHHFPAYKAVFLYRLDLERRAPQAVRSLRKLEGSIDESRMIAMNAAVKLGKTPEAKVAADFLSTGDGADRGPGFWQRLLRRTVEHLQLVSVSLLAAIVVAIPLGVMASRQPRVGQLIIGTVAAIYTIPSLALLVFMLPVLGIGAKPAVAALFLYSLLPIVRNTHAGLRGIPLSVRESAATLGLPPLAQLTRVELPLATPAIIAGIQTSAVLNVGTATLGAIIGAGGYGQPILTGIRLDNIPLILEGAVPAAVLALLVQGAFDLFGRLVIPRGMKGQKAD
jgi:osmoprotectant transport system substrate-binding protein/osmoprotectant transport system permease protein